MLPAVNNAPGQPSNFQESDGIDLTLVNNLLERARAGDESAFGEVVKMYHGRVHAVVYRLVNNEEDAKDLAQQTWVKAWKRLDSYQREAKFFTWLYRIAVNTALDFMRQKARQKEVSVDERAPGEEERETEWPVVTEDTPDRQLGREEIRVAFQAALQTLSPEHKAALILREVEGRTYREIAEITKSRVGTVMSRIFYARKTIQEKMRDVR